MERTQFMKTVRSGGKEYRIFDIRELEAAGIADVSRLPFSIRVLVENVLRHLDNPRVDREDLLRIARWQPERDNAEIPYHPARVLMQDFTGVPAVVDLAAMRDALAEQKGNPAEINPIVPVDLIIDHSVQVDVYGKHDALTSNVKLEYERNRERYTLLKWAQKSFDGVRVVPPNSGICHQVNLEYLARVITSTSSGDDNYAYPDTLIGTDSHTTMINGIGVLGWGVGGIEAEAVILGQPYYLPVPRVVGVRLFGQLQDGITATDLVLSLTHRLRKHGVVEKFVEFFGPALSEMSVPDRATLSNMAPEYGATMGYFPIDTNTIRYLEATGRDDCARLVAACAREIGVFYEGDEEPDYTETIEFDLSTVQPSLAGPARPQDLIALPEVKHSCEELYRCQHERSPESEAKIRFSEESGQNAHTDEACHPAQRQKVEVEVNGRPTSIGDGSVVIAAITSCTNTSNPSVMMGAGLLAKKAVEKGLSVPAHVKTSLAPGSPVVVEYLKEAKLLDSLEQLGFHVVGFGCTTCIGNSGPLEPAVEQAILDHDLVVTSVLSGNRNFEARIHQRVKGNFLASPLLVVAFAIAGTIDIDLSSEPLGDSVDGNPVYLSEIWPSTTEISELLRQHLSPRHYREQYSAIFDGDEFWQKLEASQSVTYPWDPESTYIKKPPYFDGFHPPLTPPPDLVNARPLMLLGDSVTTDHISPAGAIPENYPAGRYLKDLGVDPADFNSYGSRRGNHEIMMRGTFANIRIKNQLVSPREGGWTMKLPQKKETTVFEASEQYRKENTPLLVLAGKEYGTGSSRDWAAKGTQLLGVRVVLARSFERIHRSNLVGMGVLPMQFSGDDSWQSLGLDGSERYSCRKLAEITPRKELIVTAEKSDGKQISFTVTVRLDTDIEVEYFLNQGILPYVLRASVPSSTPEIS